MKVYYKRFDISSQPQANYEDLSNRPSINGIELLDNKNTEEVKITWFGTQAEFNTITPEDGTLYIIEDGVPTGEQIDYNDLIDKPTINGVTVVGNKSSMDFGMYDMDEVDNLLASMRSIKVVAALPSPPDANTVYYVGPDSENIYDVYLCDSLAHQNYLGKSVTKNYSAGTALQLDDLTSVFTALYDNVTIKMNSEGELEIPLLDLMYPVGSIYMSATLATAADVHNTMGGTWVAWGSGRVPVGASHTTQTGDWAFCNGVESTGGEKKHKITVAELPSHKHSIQMHQAGASTTGWVYNNVNKTMSVQSRILSKGGDQPHNNLMPYITCYMYKRTA